MNMEVRKLNISLLIIIYSFTGISLISVDAFSQQSQERIEFYNGVRALGMGGVVVPTVNDETALISNPAALGKLRTKYITVFDPQINSNKEGYDLASEKSSTLTESDPQEILNYLISNPNEHFHVDLSLFPSIVVPNFGFGLLGNWEANAEVRTPSNEYDFYYRNDYAALLGFNIRFFSGIIKLGFNIKYINRAEVDTTLPSSSTDLKLDNLVTEGTGIGSDVGLLLSAPLTYIPTIGVVWKDVGDTSYNLSSGSFYDNTEKPNKTKSTVDVGLSVTPILGKYIRLQLGAEYRDVLTASDETDSNKRIHAGGELNIYDKIFIRGGYHQRYWTAGLEIAGPIFSFQAASYGEEINNEVNPREDRRYVVKLSIRF